MDGKAAISLKPKTSLDITVLMGGPSTEREVSLVTGKAIADALERRGHRVRRCDISPQDASALDHKDIDVVFIALHGLFGESGHVQRLCEQRGLRYTGSGIEASRIAIDKVETKKVIHAAGLSTPNWAVLEKSPPAAEVEAILASMDLPTVLKPVDGGSSVDVTIARDAATRRDAAKDLLAKYGRGLVEQFIVGREFTVGVLGDQALPVLEVIPTHEFYDYTAKYSDDGGTSYNFDHGLPAGVVREMQSAALKTHQALGCRHMSRVDFILDSASKAWVLEANTIPGFTSHSLLPMSAAKVGIGFDELVSRIVDMARMD
jgi:D-alanine-D-alanine ligase